MNQREIILSLFNGQRHASPPAFSGLIHVTAAGLQNAGYSFSEVHRDARKMARTAASTYKLSGFPSAVVPLDLYVEAEALGAEIDFREGTGLSFPQVKKAGFQSVRSLTEAIQKTEGQRDRGRIQLVCDAIRYLKEDIGSDTVLGGMIPGPYTLLLLVVDA